MRIAFALLFLFTMQGAMAQVDPRKLDSLQQSIVQSQRTLTAWQDSFSRRQDSIYRAAINRAQGKAAGEKEKAASIAAPAVSVLLAAASMTLYIRTKWWP